MEASIPLYLRLESEKLKEDVIATGMFDQVVTHIVKVPINQNPTVLGDDVVAVLKPGNDS
jgi:hypothetical protein